MPRRAIYEEENHADIVKLPKSAATRPYREDWGRINCFVLHFRRASRGLPAGATPTHHHSTKALSAIQYCRFVLFFTQFIAGPIVHYRELKRSLRPRPAGSTRRTSRLV